MDNDTEEKIMVGTICALYMVGVTHAYMDGNPQVLVRRCSYKCGESQRVERHQIYYDDACPKRFRKTGRKTSLYDVIRKQSRR